MAIVVFTTKANLGGTITPAGSIMITKGTAKTFTITPLPAYDVLDVVINGVS